MRLTSPIADKHGLPPEAKSPYAGDRSVRLRDKQHSMVEIAASGLSCQPRAFGLKFSPALITMQYNLIDDSTGESIDRRIHNVDMSWLTPTTNVSGACARIFREHAAWFDPFTVSLAQIRRLVEKLQANISMKAVVDSARENMGRSPPSAKKGEKENAGAAQQQQSPLPQKARDAFRSVLDAPAPTARPPSRQGRTTGSSSVSSRSEPGWDSVGFGSLADGGTHVASGAGSTALLARPGSSRGRPAAAAAGASTLREDMAGEELDATLDRKLRELREAKQQRVATADDDDEDAGAEDSGAPAPAPARPAPASAAWGAVSARPSTASSAASARPTTAARGRSSTADFAAQAAELERQYGGAGGRSSGSATQPLSRSAAGAGLGARKQALPVWQDASKDDDEVSVSAPAAPRVSQRSAQQWLAFADGDDNAERSVDSDVDGDGEIEITHEGGGEVLKLHDSDED